MDLIWQWMLVLMLILPGIGAIVVVSLGASRALLARQISLGVTIAGAVCAILLAGAFLSRRADTSELKRFQPEFVPGSTAAAPHETTWNLIDFGAGRDAKGPKIGAIQFYVGIDGMNVWLLVLTAILMVASVLISWNAVQERVH